MSMIIGETVEQIRNIVSNKEGKEVNEANTLLLELLDNLCGAANDSALTRDNFKIMRRMESRIQNTLNFARRGALTEASNVINSLSETVK